MTTIKQIQAEARTVREATMVEIKALDKANEALRAQIKANNDTKAKLRAERDAFLARCKAKVEAVRAERQANAKAKGEAQDAKDQVKAVKAMEWLMAYKAKLDARKPVLQIAAE